LSDLRSIYSNQATKYHELIAHEDVEGNLLSTIDRITSISGKKILDLGSGTGRIPLLFQSYNPQIVGVDLHLEMLKEQNKQRKKVKGSWDVFQADIRCIPLKNSYFDIVTAGWSISSIRIWEEEEWEAQIRKVLKEVQRTIKPGGVIIIIETMTTGSKTPTPPTDALREYYLWLENEWGFSAEVVKSDYQF
jgi:ubiquinone/menaquinone biosynthesis C-methylase UbiE